jgi:YHS domain-containing protein
MYKVLTTVLILWLMGMGLMSISCDKEEKSPQMAEIVTTTDTKSQTLKPQTTDAFSGSPIDKSIYTDYKGKRIYFCCPNSRTSFSGDPEKYIKKLQEQGIALEDAPVKK